MNDPSFPNVIPTLTAPAAAAAAGVFALFCSTAALAFGNPTYHVFFDGGGTNAASVVALNGAPPLPAGVCGMRVSGADLNDSFYWAEYSEFGLGAPMPEAPFGPPSSATYEFPEVALETVIEFTGPLGENCEDEWVFHRPLTGDWPTWSNGTPAGTVNQIGGGALVFQVVLPNGVEWLEAGFKVWDPDNPDFGEVPETPDECELYPWLCEPADDFTLPKPCEMTLLDNICNTVRDIDQFSAGGEKQTRHAVAELINAGNDGSSVRLERVLDTIDPLLREGDALLRDELPAAEKAGRVDPRIDLVGAIRADLGAATVALRGCLERTEAARSAFAGDGKTVRTSARRGVVNEAVAQCDSAAASLAAAGQEARRLTAVGR